MASAENDLYELTKQKYEAQLRLERLQHQQRFKSLKEISCNLENMQATIRSHKLQMKATLDNFNAKMGEIGEKLERSDYININRESGMYLKNMFDKSVEIFNTNFEDAKVQDTADDDVDKFLNMHNKNLPVHAEFSSAAADLVSACLKRNQKRTASDTSEEEKTGSTHSDDTINTIICENVVASSPL